MEKKHDSQLTPKRKVPDGLKTLLEWDRKITKSVFETFDKKFGYQKYRSQMKWLENSCHGIPWLVLNVAMLYLGAWPGGLELWMNLLVYLILDITFVAIIKAFARSVDQVYKVTNSGLQKLIPLVLISFPSLLATHPVLLDLHYSSGSCTL